MKDPPLGDGNRRPSFKRSWTGLYVPGTHAGNTEPRISPLQPSEFDIMLSNLDAYRANPNVLRIWEFNPEHGDLQGLQFPEGASLVAGTDCWIWCPFLAGRLLVHSPDVSRAGIFTLGVGHSVLFDSNLYPLIVPFVESPERMRPVERESARRLIAWIVSRGYDFQMMPYVLEAYAKSPDAHGYALRATRAILALHTMDREHFRSTGSVLSDPERVVDYEPLFGTTDLDEIASAQLGEHRRFSETPTLVDVTLVAMLKMLLIRRFEMAHGSFDARFAAFDEFLFAEFGAVMMGLRNMAILYFTGHLDRWIRVQPGMNLDKALGSLRNCAWDLYLAGIPLQLLADSSDEEAWLCHFCTRDGELARLLSTSCLQLVVVGTDGRVKPFYSYDPEMLFAAIGDGAVHALERANERTRTMLERRGDESVKPVEPVRLSRLLSETVEDLARRLTRAAAQPE